MGTHEYEADPRNENIKVYINGEFFLRSQAKISVFDSGFLLGDGVWEGIRLHNGHLVHADEHLDRLFAGAESIAMDIDRTREEILTAIQDTLGENYMESDVHIRLIASRGIKKTPYQHPGVTIGDPTLVIIPEYKKASEDVKKNGIALATVKTMRDHSVQDPRINSLSKHNCIAACIEADKLGADEGLMLDPHGFVSTCNSTNFFIIRNGEVCTSTGEYCLNGVTRGSIISICNDYDIPILEKNFTVEDVHSADECFVTGTFAGVIPVVEVDGNQVSGGVRGLLTKRLQSLYQEQLEELYPKP